MSTLRTSVAGKTNAFDWGLIWASITSPTWVPPMAQFNEYLTTITLLLGIILAGVRIYKETTKPKDDNEKDR